MNKEVEARFIKLQKEEIEKKLAAIGASFDSESFFREWIYAYPEWLKAHRRIRVRTDGSKTWLTYKARKWTAQRKSKL